jgi:hypothetical protein
MRKYVEIAYLQAYFLFPKFKIVAAQSGDVSYDKCQKCGEYKHIAA